jgi:hypothetical protein
MSRGISLSIRIGIVSSQWTMTYNRGYVFRHCPLGANSDRHSNGEGKKKKMLKTRMAWWMPEGGRGCATGARQGEIGVHGGQETTGQQHRRDKNRRCRSKEDPPSHQLGIY